MKVKIVNNLNYQIYPLVEGMVEVNEQDLSRIGIDKQFDVKNKIVIDYIKIKTNDEKISKLKQNLVDTDYQAIKYAEGQMTTEEYKPIKVQRQIWRDEINQLQEELKSIK